MRESADQNNSEYGHFSCSDGVLVITTKQLHSTQPKLKFCASSIPARGVSEIYDGENF